MYQEIDMKMSMLSSKLVFDVNKKISILTELIQRWLVFINQNLFWLTSYITLWLMKCTIWLTSLVITCSKVPFRCLIKFQCEANNRPPERATNFLGLWWNILYLTCHNLAWNLLLLLLFFCFQKTLWFLLWIMVSNGKRVFNILFIIKWNSIFIIRQNKYLKLALHIANYKFLWI